MMGRKERAFTPLADVSLEQLVPQEHFYRHLDRTLDLAFVRELVRDCYAGGGRPSVDPVVFFKLQLVMFFEGLRSERQLMRVVADRLSVRWYVGYDLDEALPDPSSLTRIRERSGVDAFRRCFEAILERCREAGLLWGEELYADATKVQADAAYTSYEPRFAVEAHLQQLFAADPTAPGPADDQLADATPAEPAPAAGRRGAPLGPLGGRLPRQHHRPRRHRPAPQERRPAPRLPDALPRRRRHGAPHRQRPRRPSRSEGERAVPRSVPAGLLPLAAAPAARRRRQQVRHGRDRRRTRAGGYPGVHAAPRAERSRRSLPQAGLRLRRCGRRVRLPAGHAPAAPPSGQRRADRPVPGAGRGLQRLPLHGPLHRRPGRPAGPAPVRRGRPRPGPRLRRDRRV